MMWSSTVGAPVRVGDTMTTLLGRIVDRHPTDAELLRRVVKNLAKRNSSRPAWWHVSRAFGPGATSSIALWPAWHFGCRWSSTGR